MIPGPVLAKWLAEPAAQRRSYARIDAFIEKWSGHPLQTETERQVGELRERGLRTPEALIEVARGFIDRTTDIDALLDEAIAASRADPFFRPPLAPVVNEIHTSLILYQHPVLSIGLGVTGIDMLAAKKAGRGGARASVNFTGNMILMRFLKAGGATLSFWEAPEIDDGFVAAEAGRCRMVSRRRIADGEEIVIDGRHQSFVIDHASDDLVYFQAVARAQGAPVGTEYDADTGQFVGASSTDEADARVQMVTSLLRALGRDDVVPILADSIDGWQFPTRWHMMREMLAMDADAALPTLRHLAAADPHPDIRAAARQTLDLFFDEAPDSGAGAAACRA